MKRISFAREAANEIHANYNWMAERSLKRADRWRDRLLQAIDQIALNPERYPVADETELYGDVLREMIHGRKPHVFRILFEIQNEIVFIVRVRHASQDQLKPDEL